MDDVARRAGVSRALVSLALRGSEKVSEPSRRAVERAARELGYRPNLNARNLASKRTSTFGVLINDLHNPYFPGVVDGIKQATDAAGYRLLINSAFLDEAEEVAAIDAFVDVRVDGVILVGTRCERDVIELAAASVPIVLVSRPLDSDVVDTINNDDHLGARLATEHLVDLGHRHICHVEGVTGAGGPERRAGYVETMERHGFAVHIEPGAFTEASGVTAAERALDDGRPVTAVFAGNDLSALGVLDVLDGRGLRVPADVSLVGYDNTFVAALRHIGLTTVDQQRHRLGELSVEALLERVEGGRTTSRHEVIPPELVVRDTTAPPRPL